MTFVITEACCSDAVCTAVCPADCIHPTPDEPTFLDAEMLYIDPRSCIDCAACAEACPVNAIYTLDELPPALSDYVTINADYFEGDATPAAPRRPAASTAVTEPLSVAVVGAGPSGFYAAAELLGAGPNVTVTLIDRLPTPFGLVRAGVAPDHQDTKAITDTFAWTAAHPRMSTYFNIEVGTQVSQADLLTHHHAVVYAVGATAGRRLGVPGDDLPGSYTAAEFVGWYNGHPDYADMSVSLRHPRAVVIGNGNVALDVARLLLLGERLGHTDIADNALLTLSDTAICEVVVMGRRGPEHAAFTSGQLLALQRLEGIDVVVDAADLSTEDPTRAPLDRRCPAGYAASTKVAIMSNLAREQPRSPKRIELKFWTRAHDVVGDGTVEAIRVTPTSAAHVDASGAGADPTTIPAGLVVSCIGFYGRRLPDVPFDDAATRIPNRDGRVIGADDRPIAGLYVTGWIKRGPSGVIGTNKVCATQTVTALLDDHRRGNLPRPRRPASAFADHVAAQGIRRVDRRGWQLIDDHERRHGRAAGRPRRKIVDRDHMVALAEDPATRTPPLSTQSPVPRHR